MIVATWISTDLPKEISSARCIKSAKELFSMTKFSGIRFRLTENQKKKIKEIYRDEDGIWCILEKDYCHSNNDDAGVIHCETKKELRHEVKYIKKRGI